MNLKKSLVASVIAAALSATATGSLAENFNVPAKIKSPKNTPPAQKQTSQDSINGMTNQFDAQLGKTTFQWAAKQATKPNMGAIAVDHQNAFAADFYLKQLTGANKANENLGKPVLANIHDLGAWRKNS